MASIYEKIDFLADELVAAPTATKVKAFNDLLLTAVENAAITTSEFLALDRKTAEFVA